MRGERTRLFERFRTPEIFAGRRQFPEGGRVDGFLIVQTQEDSELHHGSFAAMSLCCAGKCISLPRDSSAASLSVAQSPAGGVPTDSSLCGAVRAAELAAMFWAKSGAKLPGTMLARPKLAGAGLLPGHHCQRCP